MVDRARPERAAEDQHEPVVLPDAQLLPRRRPGGDPRRDGPARDAVARPVAAGQREGEADAAGARREEAVGEAEVRVGLRQDERDPPGDGRQPDRAGDVAAAAEHGVGPAPAAGSAPAAPTAPAALATARAAATGLLRERPSTRIAVERVAGGGHQLGLRPLAADEGDLRALSPQRVGDRDRRDDVARGPAGGDHDPRPAHRGSGSRTGWRCAEPPCATFSSSPIEQSSTISDVEPEEMNGSGTPVSGASPSTV